jgi:hypothetical protein
MKEWQNTLNKIISLFILDEIKFSEFSESFTKIYIDQIDDSLLDEIPEKFQELYSEVNNIIEFTDVKVSNSDRKKYGITNIEETRNKIRSLLKRLEIDIFPLV